MVVVVVMVSVSRWHFLRGGGGRTTTSITTTELKNKNTEYISVCVLLCVSIRWIINWPYLPPPNFFQSFIQIKERAPFSTTTHTHIYMYITHTNLVLH